MATIGKRIKQLREERQLTQEQLAKALNINISKSTIGMYELDKREPNKETAETIADFFNVDMNYLYGTSEYRNNYEWLHNVSPSPATRKIPLLGKIACGTPITAIEHPEEYVDVPEFVKADFALLCQGDSMVNARILDGDIVYIRRQASVENGEIAAVMIDGEATLKRVFYSSGAVTLIAENPAFPPLVFAGSAAADLQILGKATYFVSKAR